MSPFRINLIFLLFSVLGYVLVSQLAVDLLPKTKLPALTVTFSLPNAPAEVVEQEGTGPLENMLSHIPHVKTIYSVSYYGRGTIELTFDADANIQFKKFEVSALIRQLYKRLNPDLTYPVIEQQKRLDKSKEPLLVYKVNATLPSVQIKKIIEDVFVNKLSQVKGVDELVIQGAENLQLTIAYDDQQLSRLGTSASDILSQLQHSFRSFYPGALLTNSRQKFTIIAGESLATLEEIKNFHVQLASGRSMPLHSIASLYWEERKSNQYFRVNGQNSITLLIFGHEDINRLNLAGELKANIAELARSLPPAVNVQEHYDDSDFIGKEIRKNFIRSLSTFGIVILFLIITYRSLAHLLILSTGIIITLGLTFLIAFIFRLHIHLYTLAGIAISLSIIIDNSIVVMEHIQTRRNKLIVTSILAASLVTIFALLLVFFLPDEDRQNLTEFCSILATTIACSALTAIFYTPALMVFVSKNALTKRVSMATRKTVRLFIFYRRMLEILVVHKKLFVAGCILTFGLPLFLLPAQIPGSTWYTKTLGNRVYQENIRPYTDRIFGGFLRPFVFNVYERSGQREPKKTQLIVNMELPYGHSLDDMNRLAIGVEDYLQGIEGIDKFITHVRSAHYATITISFTEGSEKSHFPTLLRDRLIGRSIDLSGATWNIRGIGQGFSNSTAERTPSFMVELRGYHYDQLEDYAERLQEKLLAHKRIRNININERLSWEEKNSEYRTLDFTASDYRSMTWLAKQVTDFFPKDIPATSLLMNGVHTPVFMLPVNASTFTHDLLAMRLLLEDSAYVALSSFATIQTGNMAPSIHKDNRQYIRHVSFEYMGGSNFGHKFVDQTVNDLTHEMPSGFVAKKMTWAWDFDKIKRQYGLIIILMAGIYLITAALFESFRLPFFIVVTIPLSFIGLFAVFSQFNFYFDQGGYAAFIMLGGLVVNASIYIVNDLKSMKSPEKNGAIIKAAFGKMRPVLLTILSTCLGLIPFLISGQNEVFWFALAAGTIGGLLFSIIVVFICLPVFISKRHLR